MSLLEPRGAVAKKAWEPFSRWWTIHFALFQKCTPTLLAVNILLTSGDMWAYLEHLEQNTVGNNSSGCYTPPQTKREREHICTAFP